MSGQRITLQDGLPYGTLQGFTKIALALASWVAFLVLVAYVAAQLLLGYTN